MKATALVRGDLPLQIVSINPPRRPGLGIARASVVVRDPDGHEHRLHAGDVLTLKLNLDFHIGGGGQ